MDLCRDRIWRPFLYVSKSWLESIANRQKILHRHDSSNDKLDYSRNIIRHKVLPELESLAPGASQRMVAFARDADDIFRFVDQHFSQLWQIDKLSGETLRAVGSAMGRRLIANFCRYHFDQIQLKRSHIESIWTLVELQSDGSVELPGTGKLNYKGDVVIAIRTKAVSSKRSGQYRSHLEIDTKFTLAPGSSLRYQSSLGLIEKANFSDKPLTWSTKQT